MYTIANGGKLQPLSHGLVGTASIIMVILLHILISYYAATEAFVHFSDGCIPPTTL